MLIPLSWLKEFVKIPASTDKLAEKLLLSGTKVEEINRVNGEVVLNLEITPNRPDTLSVYGVAREAAALLQEDLKEINTSTVKELKKTNKKVTFKVANKKLCPYYSFVCLGGIKVGESPEWIKNLLKASGVRPINNVVDITNFVMLELGQPMHAFDLKKLKGILTLRAAKKDEKVRTLDSQERILPEGAIIIEDEEKLIDLAGLMGGENSEVDKSTTEILLHVPIYDPVTIRKTSLLTNLRTEASGRFEKKLDPNMHPLALGRAVKLLSETASLTEISSITSVGYPLETKSVDFDFELIQKMLGLTLKVGDVMNLLSPLGFLVTKSPLQENSLTIKIPSHRQDISIPEDILEEIGRMYGYNNFPKTLPVGNLPVKEAVFEQDKEAIIRSFLLKNGFNETTGYTLVAESDLVNFGFDPKEAVKVLHPTSIDFEYLRPSLLINLVKAVNANQEHGKPLFFEVSKEFFAKIDTETNLPTQKTALVFGGALDYREIKGVLEYLLNLFNLNLQEEPLQHDNIWDFGVSYSSNKKEIARVGRLTENILKKYDTQVKTVAVWLNYDFLTQHNEQIKISPKAKFPPVIEDISFFLTKDSKVSNIIEKIENSDDLIAKVEFLDSFTKGGKNSVTLRIYYQNPQKTLTEKEVAKSREKVIKLLSKLKLTVRED